jgi:hypothetical protein
VCGPGWAAHDREGEVGERLHVGVRKLRTAPEQAVERHDEVLERQLPR